MNREVTGWRAGRLAGEKASHMSMLSEVEKLRLRLSELEVGISETRTELEDARILYTRAVHRMNQLAEHKSDCMKKLNEAVSLEKMRNGEL